MTMNNKEDFNKVLKLLKVIAEECPNAECIFKNNKRMKLKTFIKVEELLRGVK